MYLPQDELAQFGLSDDDIFAGKVTDKWRAFMKDQIRRARMFFVEAESGVVELDKDSRWPVSPPTPVYQGVLFAMHFPSFLHSRPRFIPYGLYMDSVCRRFGHL